MTRYRLTVSSQVANLYPNYRCLVIYAIGLNNQHGDDFSVRVLRSAENQARDYFATCSLSEHEHLQAWHEAFRKFGAKPKRYLCGAEALLRRVLNGSEVPSINPIVNLYNAVSIKRVIPVGGEDWDTLTGELRLVCATGDESFITTGVEGEQTDYPSPGEVIWADPAGATVRRWNWRQCGRTRITRSTESAYFVLDKLLPLTDQDLSDAGDELMDHLQHLTPTAILSSEFLAEND